MSNFNVRIFNMTTCEIEYPDHELSNDQQPPRNDEVENEDDDCFEISDSIHLASTSKRVLEKRDSTLQKQNLVYLQAVVKETLRLYPATPLLVPREAMEDCIIAGYHIPAGTRLFVNLWKMHRDPTVWINSLEFQPFGSGRRMCPGVSFALQVLHLTLARLLQGFELTTVADNPVDMSESPGLTSPKATPLEVVLSPRLPCELYEC